MSRFFLSLSALSPSKNEKRKTNLRHREHINRGAADRPIVRDDILIKYFDNAQMAISRERAMQIRDVVLSADSQSAQALESVLVG